jgi:probable F420-dependent oxidoreductase
MSDAVAPSILPISVRLFDGPGHGDAFLSGAAVTAAARAVEAAGLDSIWVTDHPIPPGADAATRAHDTLDPFVLLGHAAAATTRLRLLTSAIVLPYRNPFLTAKAAATLDVLSGGRAIVGGVMGYAEDEFRALGVDFAQRAELMDEALSVMRSVWSGEPVHHRGLTFEATGNRALPRPTQPGGPPLWVGGNSRSAISRAVTLGDGWMPIPSRAKHRDHRRTPAIETLVDLKWRIELAHARSAEAGRTEPLEIIFPLCFDRTWSAVLPVEELVESAHELMTIGVTYFTMQVTVASPERFVDEVAHLGETFRHLFSPNDLT